MIKIKDRNRIISFVHQIDADNYKDYLENGLKVIRKDSKTYYFNNGDRLINVSLQSEEKQRYVLLTKNRTITSEKLQKKYIQAITL
jgi:hypothetical protein